MLLPVCSRGGMSLRNRTSCTKASILLSVLPSNHSHCLAPPPKTLHQIPLQEGAELDCPDLEMAAKMADSEPTVTWFHFDPRRNVSEEGKAKSRRSGCNLRLCLLLSVPALSAQPVTMLPSGTVTWSCVVRASTSMLCWTLSRAPSTAASATRGVPKSYTSAGGWTSALCVSQHHATQCTIQHNTWSSVPCANQHHTIQHNTWTSP